MSDLTTILADVLAAHRIRDTAATVSGVAKWTSRCTCGGYTQVTTYREATDTMLGLSDDARTHVAEQLAVAVSAEVTTLRELVADLRDDDQCRYDHNDYCQAHSLHRRPCPHERAAALLGYRVARCGERSAHAPHIVDHGPDQPRDCPGYDPQAVSP